MKTIKGPGIFLAQFADDAAPFNTLEGMAQWAAGLGFTGVQIPSWDRRLFDLKLAAESQGYCDEVLGVVGRAGLAVTEISTHLQGQLVAEHPAYNALFEGFAPANLAENLKGRQEWAVQQLLWAAKASKRLGLDAHATFSGALAWPFFYPWPQRPAGLIDEAFAELGRRWLPILQAFDEVGVDVCYELHPGEDLHDGATFERFLEAVGGHARANILYDPSHMILQQLDYLAFLDIYLDWIDRPGRFRSLGDGQIDFKAVFSKMAQYDFPGWAVVEWECCIKHPEAGAAEGAIFTRDHIIRVTERAFDDFAGGGADQARNREVLGLG